MIRLVEDVVAEVQRRRCSPLESFVFSLRLQMWPVFQKAMFEHIESIKKLAEGTGAGFFSKGSTTTDDSVSKVRPSIFSLHAALTALFRFVSAMLYYLTHSSLWQTKRRKRWYSQSKTNQFTRYTCLKVQWSLLRLRQELTKLIARHTDGIRDSIARATTQSTLFEGLLQGLSVCSVILVVHGKNWWFWISERNPTCNTS